MQPDSGESHRTHNAGLAWQDLVSQARSVGSNPTPAKSGAAAAASKRRPRSQIPDDSCRPRLLSVTGIGALTHRRSSSSLPSTWCGGCTAPGQSISSTRRLYDCISRIDHQENNNRP